MILKVVHKIDKLTGENLKTLDDFFLKSHVGFGWGTVRLYI